MITHFEIFVLFLLMVEILRLEYDLKLIFFFYHVILEPYKMWEVIDKIELKNVCRVVKYSYFNYISYFFYLLVC